MLFEFPAIGVVHSCFKEKFGIPRQSRLAPLAQATIELLPPFDDRDAFVGIESASHLWIQFVFHANRRDTWKPRVKAPRLGGNKTLGVFATRSPTRPSPIGLSVVLNRGLREQDGKLSLAIAGMDLLDGTPVLDIKPYVPYADCVPEATNAFADAPPPLLPVHLSPEHQQVCASVQANSGTDLHGLLVQILQQDPRPSYQAVDPTRVYGIKILSVDVRFRYELIEGHPQIFVVDIVPLAV